MLLIAHCLVGSLIADRRQCDGEQRRHVTPLPLVAETSHAHSVQIARELSRLHALFFDTIDYMRN